MAKKKTALQKEYTKQLRNLKRRIKTLEKSGVYFSYDVKKDLLKTPEKISSKRLEYIKSLKGEKLYNKRHISIDIDKQLTRKGKYGITRYGEETYAQYRGRKARDITYKRREAEEIKYYYSLTSKEYQEDKEYWKRRYENENRGKYDYDYEDEYEPEGEPTKPFDEWKEDVENAPDIEDEYEEKYPWYKEDEDEENEPEWDYYKIEEIRNILDNFYNQEFKNDKQRRVSEYKHDILENAFNYAIDNYGEEGVLLNLENYGIEEIRDMLEKGMYDYDTYTSYNNNPSMQKFISIISARPISFDDAKNMSSNYEY